MNGGIANLLYLLRFQHADMPMLSTNNKVALPKTPLYGKIRLELNE